MRPVKMPAKRANGGGSDVSISDRGKLKYLVIGFTACVLSLGGVLLLYDVSDRRQDRDRGVLVGLTPEASRAIEQGRAAAKQKAWRIALDYFQRARSAAPSAPLPLYYLGVTEAEIPGHELRAMCWLLAYLASVPGDADAGVLGKVVHEVLEVKVRASVDRIRALLQQLAQKMDHSGLQSVEEDDLKSLVKLSDRVRSPPVRRPSAISPAFFRWEARRWVELVDKRMTGPALADFDEALRAAKEGREPNVRYPGDPFEEDNYQDWSLQSEEPTPEQRRLHKVFKAVHAVGVDLLAGLADALNTEVLILELQGKLAGVGMKAVVGPYSCVGKFAEGLGAVSTAGLTSRDFGASCSSEWGFINVEGDIVIPLKQLGRQHQLVFSEGLVAAENRYLDTSGKEVFKVAGYCGQQFRFGFARVRDECTIREASKTRFINKTGQLISPVPWDGGHDFSEGLARVEQGGNWGFIDGRGRLAIQPKWEVPKGFRYSAVIIGGFSDGLALVHKSGKWGYIDKKGDLVLPLKWSWARAFRDGRAAVQMENLWGFIDMRGDITVPVTYDYLGDYSEGLAAFAKGGAVWLHGLWRESSD